MNPLFPGADQFPAPASMLLEHDEFRAELTAASLQLQPIAAPARHLARICSCHFEHEETVVFPIFGLLRELALQDVKPEMAAALPLIDRFMEMQQSLRNHHRTIALAADELLAAAYKASDRTVANFAHKLKLHEQVEDDVIFPAVLLIRNCLRDGLARQRRPRGLQRVNFPLACLLKAHLARLAVTAMA